MNLEEEKNKEEKRKKKVINNIEKLHSLSPINYKKEDNYGSPSPTDFTQENNS